MNTRLIRSIRSRAAWLKAAGVLALAPLLTPDQANAFAPQDSMHYSRSIPRLSGESYFYHAKVANQRIWYVPNDSYSGKTIRARSLSGDLIFEQTDPKARFRKNYGVGYDLSADGRLYYFIESGSQYLLRIAIIGPDGTRIGDFGPSGKGPGYFGDGGEPDIAVSPSSGRIYVTDEAQDSGYGSLDPAKKGLVRVFDRDGNFLSSFRTNGILAETLESSILKMVVRSDSQGQDEVLIIDGGGGNGPNWKFFGGDGQFRRLMTGSIVRYWPERGQVFFWKDRLVLSDRNWIHVFPANGNDGNNALASIPQLYDVYRAVGVDDSGAWINYYNYGSGNSHATGFDIFSYPNFSNFDAVSRNAVPNPWVLGIAQRPGSGVVDIDYRVDDLNDSTVTTALVGFANGVASLTNVLPLNTLLEGTGSRIGANQPTGTVQRVTWNAGGDWNVDFGTLRVMALARDSRSHWFDTHLVEIPADGTRPAVTISRNPMRQDDFLAQFFWLVATKDPSVRLVDGVLFGTTGSDNGVILANGTASTAAGRTFLLKRDGLRVATTDEVTRAREGATPGFTVQLDPPLQMRRSSPAGTFPNKINEFGIEASPSGTAGNDFWYVVRDPAD
ncbi:MAG: hypothetical protein RLZZ245_2308 [Verrucomicrobiota bacterium]|jgi:hypothetical protein